MFIAFDVFHMMISVYIRIVWVGRIFQSHKQISSKPYGILGSRVYGYFGWDGLTHNLSLIGVMPVCDMRVYHRLYSPRISGPDN